MTRSMRVFLLFTLVLIVADRQTIAGAQSLALFNAASSGDKELVTSLLASGANVDERDSRGWTPLFAAVANGHTEIADLLLTRGADANAKQPNGVTVLYVAVSGGLEEVAKQLLARGAQANAATEDGGTALHVAAGRGNANMVALLLANGADVNVKCHVEGEEGNTPLHVAQAQRQWRDRGRPGEGAHVQAAELLLAKGAAVNAKNDRGKTPLALAETKEMKALLRKYGAK